LSFSSSRCRPVEVGLPILPFSVNLPVLHRTNPPPC
jgi:hypothetical protein